MGLMAALQRFGFLKMTYFRILLSAFSPAVWVCAILELLFPRVCAS